MEHEKKKSPMFHEKRNVLSLLTGENCAKKTSKLCMEQMGSREGTQYAIIKSYITLQHTAT